MNNNLQSRLPDLDIFELLRCGYNHSEFTAKLLEFHSRDQEGFEKINNICGRIKFIENLQFIAQGNVHDIQSRKFRYQLERLTAYLACTCIEILASSKYQVYPDWFIRQIKDKKLDSFFVELENANANTLPSLMIEWTKRLRETHNQEKGLSRNFRRFFDENSLPEWIREWLSDSYFISEDDISGFYFDKASYSWKGKNINEKINRIAKHLYEQVRNQYTHTVDQHSSLENNGKYGDAIPINIFGDIYKFIDININKSNKKYCIGLRDGLSEVDVINFLIICHIRKKIY